MSKNELARLRIIRVTARFRKQRLGQYSSGLLIVILSFWQINANKLN